MRKIFINEFGRLRSGWRLVLFIAAFIAIYFVVGVVVQGAYLVLHSALPSNAYVDYAANFMFRLLILIAALGGGYVCAKWLEGLPWRSLGLTFHNGWLRDLLIGCAIGFVALAVAVGIAAAAGGLRFSFAGVGTTLVRSLIGWASLFFVAALAEEALFRGYGLQTLSRAQMAGLGVLLTSVPFALVHLENPNVVRGVTFINTALAGIWFAAAYLRTRSLWFPLGLHWSWNWALGSFFGLPVSGAKVPHSLLNGNDLGPAWLTGGNYGIEGGVACTVAMAAFTLFTWFTPWVSATPELKKLTSEENPVLPSPVVSIRPADDAA